MQKKSMTMKHWWIFLLLISSSAYHSFAQPAFGLVAFYSFDDDADTIVVDKTGNFANNAFSNALIRDCGVVGKSIRFDGNDDYAEFGSSAVINVFGTEDFSISFYFKSLNSNSVSTQTILSKRENCSIDRAFAIRYSPLTRNLNLILSEDASLSANLSVPLDENRCWHHVAVVRRGTRITLFVDGLAAKSDLKNRRINITLDDMPLLAGPSSCLATDGPFEGFLDELLLYNRALTDEEVKSIFQRPDQIGNGFTTLELPKDTILYLGNSIQTFITNSCANSFAWSPTTGVANPSSPQTLITPDVTTTYTLTFLDDFNCTATDQLLVTVIDPADLDCKAFLPNAFTPNDDGRNDLFGIDNPYVMTDFISLEVFDRWGNLVFFTEDPFQRWDGAFRGQALNPGVVLYKVRYRCSGEEQVQSGTLTIIR
jgi:gliding motility-associated-like protein